MVTVVPGNGGKVPSEATKAMNVLARWSGLGCFDPLLRWEYSSAAASRRRKTEPDPNSIHLSELLMDPAGLLRSAN
jgi:hypothetical protein